MAKACCGVSVMTVAERSGTMLTFLGWMRQAAARVRANCLVNLRPVQKVRCVLPASLSGLRSSICVAPSAA